MKLSDLFVGRNGKISRTATAFVLWFIFIISLIGYSTYKLDGKIPDLQQPYVYLTVVFCGTYTARRYLDNKVLGIPTDTTTTTTTTTVIPPNPPTS